MSTAQPLSLPCPKCATPMRTLERSGIHLETCPECRGIFLDRGELDRLIDLEADAASRFDRSGADRDRGRGPGHEGAFDRSSREDWDDDEGGARAWSDRGGPSRRRGFLGELFEGFGD